MTPRVVRIRSSLSYRMTYDPQLRTCHANADFPTALHICHESRTESLKVYHACFGNVLRHPVYPAPFDIPHIGEPQKFTEFIFQRRPDSRGLGVGRLDGVEAQRMFDSDRQPDLAFVRNVAMGPFSSPRVVDGRWTINGSTRWRIGFTIFTFGHLKQMILVDSCNDIEINPGYQRRSRISLMGLIRRALSLMKPRSGKY